MRRSTTLLTLVAVAALLTVAAPAWADDNCEYPQVLIVLDHSDSMARTLSGTDTTIWAVTVDAIRQTVLSYEDSIAFGLMIFPDPVDNGCAPGSVLLAPAPEMAAEIMDILDNQIPAPDASIDAFTPIKQTYDALIAQPTLWDDSTRNYVLFITDGEQYCDCESRTDDPCVADATKPATLLDMGIPSFIMGLSTQTNSCLMARMALHGGTAREECPYDSASFSCNNPWDSEVEHPEKACYYQADDSAGVLDALENIGREVTDEQCDLLDNDCDGLTDEDLVESCETICGEGETSCVNGLWTECEPLTVDDESCNGADDDCDGFTDEDLTRPCYTDCDEGFETCVMGDWVDCTADPDCECTPDDERDCGSNVGKCIYGTQTCGADGTWGDCEGGTTPDEEVCNGADDNCDGSVDEDLERACETACGTGTEACEDGDWVDCTAPEPVAEECNGVDDDCDGDTDEELGERACESACGEGVETCVDGDWAGCTAPQPTDETCNGVDDDCDGSTDEEATCPEGQACVEGACTQSDNPGMSLDSAEGSANSCQAGGNGSAAPVALLALLLAAAVLRRRFTA